jgi:hypothetical protein
MREGVGCAIGRERVVLVQLSNLNFSGNEKATKKWQIQKESEAIHERSCVTVVGLVMFDSDLCKSV